MNERVYYSAAEIAQMLGVSMGKAYKILREMNQELAAKGYLTFARDKCLNIYLVFV